jgi:hypothetical protein
MNNFAHSLTGAEVSLAGYLVTARAVDHAPPASAVGCVILLQHRGNGGVGGAAALGVIHCCEQSIYDISQGIISLNAHNL